MALASQKQRTRDEYSVDRNAEQAAIRDRYSQHSPIEIEYDSRGKSQANEQIGNSGEEGIEKTKITAEWLLKRLVDEAVADMNDLFDVGGALLPVDEWPLIWRQGLIIGVDVAIIKGPDGAEIGVLKKIKFSDRLKRIELIGRHVDVNAFKDRASATGIDDVAEQFARMLERERLEYSGREAK